MTNTLERNSPALEDSTPAIAQDRVTPDQNAIGSFLASHDWAKPNEEELVKANRFRPQNSPPYTADSIRVLNVLASDNLVNKSGVSWMPSALQQMESKFPGATWMLDHEWENTDRAVGKIFDTKLTHYTEIDDSWLGRIDNKERREQAIEIIEEEGLWELYVKFYMGVDCLDLLSSIYFSRLNKVSTGGWTDNVLVCPRSQQEFIKCTLEDCPACIPQTSWLFFEIWDMDEEELEERLAPYYRRPNFISAEEVSFVGTPNLYRAGVSVDMELRILLPED